MSRILVLGCGELAWGHPSSSVLFGRQWTRGRLSERIGLGPDGPLPGEAAGQDWVTLADELDRQWAWRPAEPLESAPNVIFLKGQQAKAPLLPAWPELAASQARWATRELRGAGVLVTPQDWLESAAGRQLLAAWAGEGWSWAPLERVLRERYSADARYVSAGGLWLRVLEDERGCVFANGPEAARALDLAPAILDRALEQLGSGLAERWRREEEPESGWYVHQQLARRIAKALRDGQTTVDLTGSSPFQLSREGKMVADPGSPSGVLFRFSTAEAQERYQALSALRIKVGLPAAALPWWEKVSQPDFLRSPARVTHPGIRWEDRKTVLLEGTESRQFANYLAFRGLEREEVDPARLEEALELGSPLPPSETVVQKAPAPPAQAPVSPPAPPAKAAIKESAPLEAVAPQPAVETSVAPPQIELAAAVPSTVEPPLAEEDLELRTAALADDEQTGEMVESAPVEEKVTALSTFVPRKFNLDVPHRPDRVRVWLDGERVEPGNVRRSIQPGAYTIEGIPVPHGAIVRIDFEPPQD